MTAEFCDNDTVHAALDQFRELGGDEFVTEMIDLLNQQTPRQFDEIEKSLSSGDITVAQRHAHSMKSSFGNFGATRCQELATRMDSAGKRGDTAAYQSDFELLKQSFCQLQDVLKS